MRHELEIIKLANDRRLRIRRDDCGDPIIPGQHGEIGEHGDVLLNACFHGTGAEAFSRLRAQRIRRTLAGGFGTRISGGEGADEALFAFARTDAKAVKWFIDALGIRQSRSVSPEVAERLRHFARKRRGIARKRRFSLKKRPQQCQQWAG
jgi:hypothetical protein